MHVMSSVQYQNKKAQEPIYELDVTVPTPDLNDDTMYSSNLTFINISEELNTLIERKIKYARQHFIDKMTIKNKDVQAHKNLLRQLEKDGLSVIPAIDDNQEYDNIEFKSCGDIHKDLQNITNKTIQSQTQLFELDQNYYPIHSEIKKLQNVQHELDTFIDNYKMKLSQLNRVLQRIGKHIEENKTLKESSNEAMKATHSQQSLMLNKISEKLHEVETKITHLLQKEEEEKVSYEDEINKQRQFLLGLKEFIVGLNKIKKTSESKIAHLDSVVAQLIQQRAVINKEIRNLKESAIIKLRSIRNDYFMNPSMDENDIKQDIIDKDSSDLNEVQLPNYLNAAPSTMVGLLHIREKYMNDVYKRIHDLESRALTTSSTNYLSSLTEIRELQLIFSDTKLRYFYNKYVSSCNEVFNDCCLAFQAILEYTAEINSPIITQLKGVQLLNSVLKNKKVKNEDHEDTQEQLEIVVDFVQSLPDREIVIMQVARYLATSLPFRNIIRGTDNKRWMNEKNDEEELNEASKDGKQLVKIDGFVMIKIREWMGSILEMYGNSVFNSVKVALENDVVAQVRPSNAARLIVNCVYGLDVSW